MPASGRTCSSGHSALAWLMLLAIRLDDLRARFDVLEGPDDLFSPECRLFMQSPFDRKALMARINRGATQCLAANIKIRIDIKLGVVLFQGSPSSLPSSGAIHASFRI